MSRDTWAKAFLKRLGIGDALRPRWSYAPRREAGLYYELFHTSPRLDSLYMMASDVASATFKVYDKKQKKFDEENADPIQEHPIYDVLENPMPEHKEMDGFTLMFLTVVYRELIGEAFWLIERNNAGLPAEIYPVPPNWILTTPTAPTPYFMIVPMGNTSHKPLSVPDTDVIWFKEPNILSPFGRGRARTEAIGDELEADELAAKYGKNYFFNDATPPIVIEAPGATPEMAERFKESWFQKVGGYLNARKPGIIPWKDSKITKLADSAREMDFVETRKFLRDVCNQHWSQPPELSGILENSNRSTIDSAYYLWTKNAISKKLARMEATLNRQLVPMFDDSVVLKYDNVVPQDDAFDLQVATAGLGAGALTVNEWRQKNGMKPDEKGGDIYLRPFALSPVNANESPPLAPAPVSTVPSAPKKTVKYNEDQPRDEQGRFGEGSGTGKISLTKSEQSALDRYSKDGFTYVNSSLRAGTRGAFSETIPALDSAIAKSGEFEGMVYRGGNNSMTAELLRACGVEGIGERGDFLSSDILEDLASNYSQQISSSVKGSVLTDKAFTSVTTDKDIAGEFRAGEIFGTRLELKASGRSLDVSSNLTADKDKQSERLFPRNSKMRLTSAKVVKEGDGYVLVVKGTIHGD